eukprot:m.124771 g.124771  ORF g.124771 m.124771 type:complete len:548 (-) comp16303_c0_seq1:290-1933(-)
MSLNEKQPLLPRDDPVAKSPPLWDRRTPPTINMSVNNDGSRATTRSASPELDQSAMSPTRAPIEYKPHAAEAKDHHNLYQRTKYYSRLAPANKSSLLLAPKHVVPLNFFVIGGGKPGSQSSLVTILSLWNTMMGTSVLAMPWALNQAGFTTGIAIMIGMATLTFYTCYIVMTSGGGGRLNGEDVEFAEVVKYFLGDRYYYVAVIFSVFTLVGVSAVYWVLMSGFLYNTVDFFHDPHVHNTTLIPDPAHNGTFIQPDPDESWHHVWSKKYVPIYLVIILFPLVNMKSLTFFTKLNALGVLSIAYIIFFVIFNAAQPEDRDSPSGGFHMDHAVEFKSSFAALTGVLCMSFFIHNGCLSIMRNQRNPHHNTRDLFLAYLLVCATYLLVGVTFYCSFKGTEATGWKDGIESNLLQNFSKGEDTYIYALVAQLFLLFQMITVYPLLNFILRFQVMTLFDMPPWPSFWHVGGLNCGVTIICVLVAVFYPNIGTIIRFTGALCGLAYIFALPCMVKLEQLKREGRSSKLQTALHLGLIAIGVANVIGQFLLKPS